jgi:hypothetical protein
MIDTELNHRLRDELARRFEGWEEDYQGIAPDLPLLERVYSDGGVWTTPSEFQRLPDSAVHELDELAKRLSTLPCMQWSSIDPITKLHWDPLVQSYRDWLLLHPASEPYLDVRPANIEARAQQLLGFLIQQSVGIHD